MVNDIDALLERVKAATGPDRELDDAILKSLNIHSWAGRMSYPELPMWVDFGPSNITGSIDAALALTQRVLPGWHWSIYDTDGRGRKNCQVETPDHQGEPFDGVATTAPLAIIAATLSALTNRGSSEQ